MTETYKKITINVSEDVYCTLRHLANEQGGITVVELIKRAVALYKFVWENRDARLLLERDGVLKEITLLEE